MKDFIKKPPMGWNSWDCYGAGVTEDELLGNAEFMRDRLKQYGYQYVVCDIQWYEPAAKGNVYNNFADLCMDEYSRLIPAVNRFPSSANGAGFKPIADKIHSMGLNSVSTLCEVFRVRRFTEIRVFTAQLSVRATLLLSFRCVLGIPICTGWIRKKEGPKNITILFLNCMPLGALTL